MDTGRITQLTSNPTHAPTIAPVAQKSGLPFPLRAIHPSQLAQGEGMQDSQGNCYIGLGNGRYKPL